MAAIAVNRHAARTARAPFELLVGLNPSIISQTSPPRSVSETRGREHASTDDPDPVLSALAQRAVRRRRIGRRCRDYQRQIAKNALALPLCPLRWPDDDLRVDHALGRGGAVASVLAGRVSGELCLQGRTKTG